MRKSFEGMNFPNRSVQERVAKNMKRMEEKNFDQNMNIEEYYKQVLEDISEKEIFEELSSKAQKLSIYWKEAIEHLARMEPLIGAEISKNLKPDEQYTSEERLKVSHLAGCKTFIRMTLVSIKNTVDSLNSGKIETLGMAIVGSGALQEQLDTCIKEIEAQGVGVNILDLQLTSKLIESLVSDIPNF